MDAMDGQCCICSAAFPETHNTHRLASERPQYILGLQEDTRHRVKPKLMEHFEDALILIWFQLRRARNVMWRAARAMFETVPSVQTMHGKVSSQIEIVQRSRQLVGQQPVEF